MITSALQPLVDELRYQNFAANRAFSPHVPLERWGRIYGDVREFEARYQAEKAIAKAQSAQETP